jgi:hypothetical protein
VLKVLKVLKTLSTLACLSKVLTLLKPSWRLSVCGGPQGQIGQSRIFDIFDIFDNSFPTTTSL